ncbi:hypothetical protein AB0F24_28545 [Streptomyces platensis]|uniref:hypothetical protein n=1 Tax=Streptomyces platensis TaxID=58346 RepID=UPI0033E5F2C2
MSNAPVDPAEVPVFTGDLDLLESKVKALSHGGSQVKTIGSDVHKSFGGLAAFYKAPEAEQLFGVTQPVADKAHDLGEDMHAIARALGTYAREITPLVEQLKQLKQDAADFRAKDAADDDWREDGDLVDENLNRRNKIAEVWAAFQEAERDCHAKIVGLVGGKALHTIDGSHPTGYGYDAEALKASKSLPWGDAVEESVPWWQVWEHAYDFGKGVVVDGVWGTIKGLGTLIGVDGWDAAGQAWTGLAKLATGVAITTLPFVGPAFLMIPGDKLPSWLRDSRTAMKETGKALVAWDQWESNGSRAAGAVTFNVITAIFTRGGGAAVSGTGKAATAAKAVSIAGKVGHAIDPMTYVFKGAGAGISKIGNVMAHLKGLGHVEAPKISEGAYSLPEGATKMPDGTVQLPKGATVPDGAIKLPDGRIKLPEGTVTLPPNTVKDPFNGRYMDGAGSLYKEDGSLLQRAEDAPKGETASPAASADNPRIDSPVHQDQRVPAGVGGRGDDFTRVDPGTTDQLPVASDTAAHANGHSDHITSDGAPGEGAVDWGRSHEEPTIAGHAGDGIPDDPALADWFHGKGNPTPNPQTHSLGEGRSGFSIMESADPFYRNALKANPIAGHYDIVAHGTPHEAFMHSADGRKISPQDMANIVRRRPDYTPGTPIRLLSCNTGHTDGTFARRLAHYIKAPVVAPDGYLYSSRRGWFGVDRELSYKVRPSQVRDLPGAFYRYSPDGRVEKLERSDWAAD